MCSHNDDGWGFFVDLELDTDTNSHYYHDVKKYKCIQLDTIEEGADEEIEIENKSNKNHIQSRKSTFLHYVLRYICFIIFVLYFQTLI